MKVFIEFSGKNWVIENEKSEIESATLGIYHYQQPEWIRYGTVYITKDPASCSISFERNNMPYLVIRELDKIITKEVERIGVDFKEKVYSE